VNLTVLPGTLAVCRLPASDRIPSWALELHEGFVSITRTPDELSIVCPQEAVPPDTQVEEGFRALMVPGPIPFEETGVMARIATPLAAAGISIFAIATYDTDYVLVRETDLERALAALPRDSLQGIPCRHALGGRRLIKSGSPYEPVIGFSRAVRSGHRVLVSGTGPVMPDGGCPETTLDQARRCWEIVLAALAEAGASVRDVVRTRTFLTAEASADGAMTAHGEVFAAVRPASTMLVVAALLDGRWHVEVEAEAQLDP
jgi:enamine deaminase RidA (YjgF/YER057c/UK114 family)